MSFSPFLSSYFLNNFILFESPHKYGPTYCNLSNKYFKENNELKEFPKIMQNYGNLTKEKQNELVKELVEIKLWDFIIINRNLGEIADNSEQTILKHVRELNPKLDFLKKIKVTNINITTALITSNDENCPGGVIVALNLLKKQADQVRHKKQLQKMNQILEDLNVVF